MDGPLKCFNPSKNWRLGWYNDTAVAIGLGESWCGRLVSFVDYELADPSKKEVVLLRLGAFLFVQYNRTRDFNVGTSIHRDKVVDVGGLSSSSSVLHAKCPRNTKERLHGQGFLSKPQRLELPSLHWWRQSSRREPACREDGSPVKC